MNIKPKTKKKRIPRYFITYICNRCGFDFAMVEWYKPRCFYCECKTDYRIISKQPFSWELVAKRMELVNNRMEVALKGAWGTRPKESENIDKIETDLISALSSAKKIKRETQKIGKKNKKYPRKNIIFICSKCGNEFLGWSAWH